MANQLITSAVIGLIFGGIGYAGSVFVDNTMGRVTAESWMATTQAELDKRAQWADQVNASLQSLQTTAALTNKSVETNSEMLREIRQDVRRIERRIAYAFREHQVSSNARGGGTE